MPLTDRGNAYQMIDDISYDEDKDRIKLGINCKPYGAELNDYIIAPKYYDISKIFETYIFAIRQITTNGVY